MYRLTQKIITLGTACMVALACTVVVAQSGDIRPMPEKMIQHQREMMEKRYSAMDTEKLMKRKNMLEKRIEKAKDNRQKQRFEIELDVINSLLNQ